jgi:hypothetical protein
MGERTLTSRCTTRRHASRRYASRAAAMLVVVAGCVSAGAAGCTAPRGPLVVTDPDPSVKIPAIKNAVRKRDRAAARQLVADLDSDDPAVRFYAINGLQRMTGERFGYDYYADEEQRQPAVQRWREWLAAQEPAREKRGNRVTR